MKKMTVVLFSLLCSGFAHAATSTGVLFEVTRHGLVPADVVGDSVFHYAAKDIECDENADEETPCLAKPFEDKWQTVCFQGDPQLVCPAFKELFRISDEILMDGGAEESVELNACVLDNGIHTLTYTLWSGHGGPNVKVKNKLIPMCPIFF
jgi:hypothetical protein